MGISTETIYTCDGCGAVERSTTTAPRGWRFVAVSTSSDSASPRQNVVACPVCVDKLGGVLNIKVK